MKYFKVHTFCWDCKKKFSRECESVRVLKVNDFSSEVVHTLCQAESSSINAKRLNSGFKKYCYKSLSSYQYINNTIFYSWGEDDLLKQLWQSEKGIKF